ncbi:hypothetical protein, partial [Brucella suis]|uniref:hypothetical protein n=1 Tax=Brucella suis TaxID=29461 RepID=UPI001FFD15AF
DIAAGDIRVERPVARPVSDGRQNGLRYPAWFLFLLHPYSPVRSSVPVEIMHIGREYEPEMSRKYVAIFNIDRLPGGLNTKPQHKMERFSGR